MKRCRPAVSTSNRRIEHSWPTKIRPVVTYLSATRRKSAIPSPSHGNSSLITTLRNRLLPEATGVSLVIQRYHHYYHHCQWHHCHYFNKGRCQASLKMLGMPQDSRDAIRWLVLRWVTDLLTGKPSWYIANTKVNSAFRPYGVGKLSNLCLAANVVKFFLGFRSFRGRSGLLYKSVTWKHMSISVNWASCLYDI